MLRHATKPKADSPPSRRTRRAQKRCLYTVAHCPDNLYLRGAQFSQGAVIEGLLWENWPVGMTFITPTGQRLVVQGGAHGWYLKEAALCALHLD